MDNFVPGLVSVVVASYNHANYLSRRMDSLISQTYRDLEILVIDDCSPDNSLEILRRYASHPNVQLIERKENGGWVTVSNQGVQLARGEFILFANCDDSCEPRMVESLVDALRNQPSAGVAFCRSSMVDEDDVVLGDDFQVRERAFRLHCASDAFITGDHMYRYLLHSCVIPNLSAALIHRRCFESAGLLTHEYRACSDWDLFFRIAEHDDFAYVAAPLNHFRQHKTTIRSSTKGRVTYDEFFRLLLGQVRIGKLSWKERARYRYHVMYLWSLDLIRPSMAGWVNVFHHAIQIAYLDRVALLYFPLAMLGRAIELPVKAIGKIVSKLVPNSDHV